MTGRRMGAGLRLTLAGLRFVRNRIGDEADLADSSHPAKVADAPTLTEG
jgi:hypothetical protein